MCVGVSASHVNTVNNLADLANRDDGCVWVYQPVSCKPMIRHIGLGRPSGCSMLITVDLLGILVLVCTRVPIIPSVSRMTSVASMLFA